MGEIEVLVCPSPLHRTRCVELCARIADTIFIHRHGKNLLCTNYKGHRSPTSTQRPTPEVYLLTSTRICSTRLHKGRTGFVGSGGCKAPSESAIFLSSPANPSLTDAPVTTSIPLFYSLWIGFIVGV